MSATDEVRGAGARTVCHRCNGTGQVFFSDFGSRRQCPLCKGCGRVALLWVADPEWHYLNPPA